MFINQMIVEKLRKVINSPILFKSYPFKINILTIGFYKSQVVRPSNKINS